MYEYKVYSSYVSHFLSLTKRSFLTLKAKLMREILILAYKLENKQEHLTVFILLCMAD